MERAHHTKVTRQDWLDGAKEVLITDGVEQVKVLTLSSLLNVSRSSFYWYFKDRNDLLDALLEDWLNTNTKALVDHSQLPADTINDAVCNVFQCFFDQREFNTRLDFAIRDWSRRAPKVHRVLEASDVQRIEALAQMFARYAYDATEALCRARVLYYMQIGYNDAELEEPTEVRLELVEQYLQVFTGQQADAGAVAEFRKRITALVS